jgi:hypothetical protein
VQRGPKSKILMPFFCSTFQKTFETKVNLSSLYIKNLKSNVAWRGGREENKDCPINIPLCAEIYYENTATEA